MMRFFRSINIGIIVKNYNCMESGLYLYTSGSGAVSVCGPTVIVTVKFCPVGKALKGRTTEKRF
jgi:hypothetical protein